MIVRIWPLFFGLALVGLTVGAQGSLLGLRATLEGFSTLTTGLVMSGYFGGFVFGSLFTPRLIAGVGHVRTFGALAALASVAVLVHALVVEPRTWFAMRLLSGFAVSGIYVVTESWLNHATDDRRRGRILSAYMLTIFLGLGLGQFLLNLAPPESFMLYTLLSVLISVAAVPILLTAVPMPPFTSPERAGVRGLFRWAPMGGVVIVLANLFLSVFLGMGAVYASSMELPVDQVALFMAAGIGGGALLQWPLGRLSDHFDRRLVIALSGLAACIAATTAALAPWGGLWPLLLLTGLVCGFSFPLYALTTAMVNDMLSTERAVAVASTLILVGGAGATAGPFLASAVMARFGAAGFFWTLATLGALVALLAGFRYLTSPYLTIDEQTAFAIRAPDGVGTILAEPAAMGDRKP